MHNICRTASHKFCTGIKSFDVGIHKTHIIPNAYGICKPSIIRYKVLYLGIKRLTQVQIFVPRRQSLHPSINVAPKYQRRTQVSTTHPGIKVSYPGIQRCTPVQCLYPSINVAPRYQSFIPRYPTLHLGTRRHTQV
jgi:hypothetical protein